DVVNGTFNLGKTTGGNAVQQANGASLIIESGASAVITGAYTDQIQDSSSVVVKSGGTFDLNGHSETFDGLAGSGTASVTSASAATLILGSANDANISANTLAAANAGVGSTGL